jgi:hypothetical protein
LSLPLQTHIRNAIVFDDVFASDGRRAAAASPSSACAALQTLVRHLLVSCPQITVELVPNITAGLDSSKPREAVMAAEFLSLLLAAPLPGDTIVAASALAELLRASASPLAELRVKVANVLPTAARSGAVANARAQCQQALRARLLDAEGSVRAAAVRGLGAVLAGGDGGGSGGADDDLDALTERLKDSVPEVRAAVRVAAAAPLTSLDVLTSDDVCLELALLPHSAAPVLLSGAGHT